MNANAAAATVVDPVCHMEIDPSRAAGSTVYDGVRYSFCSRGCEAKFDADPDRYLAGSSSETAAGSCCSTGHSCC